MARPLRLEIPGGLYHVTSRGDRRENIYLSDTDRQRWLDLLFEVCSRHNWLCHAYCLMDNHYHVVVETIDGNLSAGMRQLNGVYTQWHNRAHDRVGMWGVAAPSANQFGRVSPTTAAHVQGEFGADLLILDGGPCAVGIESTIIDCTRGVPVLLRPGAITPDNVLAACGLSVRLPHEMRGPDAPAPRASGTLESHYAPLAKVCLMDALALQQALDVLGSELDQAQGRTPDGPSIAVYARAPLKSRSAQVLIRRMPDDAPATAQQLFAVLREFDAQGVKLIWIEIPPDAPEWDGVRDRLQRASVA